MEAITASLERSLQNCSLNNHTTREQQQEQDVGIGISSSSDDVVPNNLNNNGVSNSDTTLELNSHISLPYHWEQCLDLKSGEIYYINWRNGMKAKEDPRRVEAASREYSNNINNSIRDYYESVDEEEEEDEEEEDGWYDSEESSSESYPSSSKEGQNSNNSSNIRKNNSNSNVLVVAGCKSCLMYFMVPKQVEDCPKCSGQLLHFDRSENGSP